VLYAGDAAAGGEPTVLTPAYSRTLQTSWGGYGVIRQFAGYSAGSHDYVFMVFFEPISAYECAYYAGLYDVTTSTWVYERRALPAEDAPATVVNGLILRADGHAMIAYGKQLLTWDVPTGMVTAAAALPDYATALHPAGALTVVEAGSSLLVYETATGKFRYQLAELVSALRIDGATDRAVLLGSNSADVYALSSGERLQTVQAPCENDQRAWLAAAGPLWKANGSTIELTVVSGGQMVYRYR
jgi:hypothetical protein